MIRQDEHVGAGRVCRVLELSRTSYYRNVRGVEDYTPRKRAASEKASNTFVERAQALAREPKHCFYGHRKIHAVLLREGVEASRYQVFSVLSEAHLNLPSTWMKDLREGSKALKEYTNKPQRPLELLQADITHIPIEGYGTYYVIDVIDYVSKVVLASIFADRHGTDELIRACEETLVELKRRGLTIPEKITLLTDNGPAMISRRFRKYITGSPFRHIRTRNHHPQTNGCIERYHQTLKYEEVWGAMYDNPMVARERIEAFVKFYNEERLHQALGYKTPMEKLREYQQQITYQQAV